MTFPQYDDDKIIDIIPKKILDGSRPLTTRSRRYFVLVSAVLGVAEMVWPSQAGPISGIRTFLNSIFGAA